MKYIFKRENQFFLLTNQRTYNEKKILLSHNHGLTEYQQLMVLNGK